MDTLKAYWSKSRMHKVAVVTGIIAWLVYLPLTLPLTLLVWLVVKVGAWVKAHPEASHRAGNAAVNTLGRTLTGASSILGGLLMICLGITFPPLGILMLISYARSH